MSQTSGSENELSWLHEKPKFDEPLYKRNPKEGMCLCPGDSSQEEQQSSQSQSETELLNWLKENPTPPTQVYTRHPKEGMCLCPEDVEDDPENIIEFDNDKDFEEALCNIDL